MRKIFKAVVACVIAIAFVLNPLMEIKVFAVNARMANIPETGTMSIAQLQQEFPTGAYWNHVSKDEENPSPYQVTDTPCNHIDTGVWPAYLEGDRCNSFRIGTFGVQMCGGFAALMCYLYSFGKGVNPEDIEMVRRLDYNEVQVGDIIAYDDHAVFVAELLGSGKVKVGEANYNKPCIINWGREINLKTLFTRSHDSQSRFEVLMPVKAGAFDKIIRESEEENNTVYRFYNPKTGGHAFLEYGYLFNLYFKNGWEKEKSAGKTPDSSNTPVYELINITTGELLYTSDRNEYDTLNGNGWYDRYWESPAFYSADGGKNPVYRLNKPGSSGPASHHYTSDKKEIEILIRDHGYMYDNGGNPVFTLL